MDIKKEKKKNTLIVILSVFIIVSSLVIASSVLYVYVLKPQNTYNIAIELYENGDYEAAKSTFEGIKDFKDSSDLIAKCDESILEKKQQEEKDNAAKEINKIYYGIVEEYVKLYGAPKAQPDPLNEQFGTHEVAGVCLVKQIDFNNDGQNELFIGYNSKEPNPYIMAYDVYAIIDGKAKKIVDTQEAEYRAQDCGYISFEVYKKDDLTYLYHWNSTCAEDFGWIKSFDGKELHKVLEWQIDEDGYKFTSDVLSDEEMPDDFPSFYLDLYQGTLDAEPVTGYHQQGNGIDMYAIFFLSEADAKALQEETANDIEVLKNSCK